MNRIKIRFPAVWFACATLIFVSSMAQADSPEIAVQYRDQYEVDSIGNAKITRTFQFPPASYARVKQQTQDPLLLIRNISSTVDWHEIKVIGARFEDGKNRIVAEFTQKGLARSIAPHQWEIKSRAKPGFMELITCTDERVVFHAADQSEWGPMSATIVVNLCVGASNVEFDKTTAVVRYRTKPIAEKPSDLPESEWKLEVAPQLMSALANVYSNEDFGLFWTARSVFTNIHDEPLTKFQVRYQLDGYSSWSPWKKTPIVHPGQSVVESFFPVLDIDTLGKLDGARTATLLAEYRYVDADGQLVEHSDTQNIKILSRNEVVCSRHNDSESINWQEANEYLPILVTSYCNSNDPLIQQLAGRISGMANGPAASLASEDAINYLRATWKFMEDNQIVFQRSASLETEQKFGNRIKFARDVLNSRSGTCVDFAVFWASSMKAVGMKSYIVLVPGNAFPMVELQNGKRVPLDASLIGKGTIDEAATNGNLLLEQALKGPHFIVDIGQFEDNGVRAIELERASEDFFDKLGFKFEKLEIATENPDGN